MIKKCVLYISFMAFANSQQAQEFNIPKLDWVQLEKTKPWKKTEDWHTNPRKVMPGHGISMPPSDAITLFDGQNLDPWQRPNHGIAADLERTKAIVKNNSFEKHPGTRAEWIVKDGVMHVVPGKGNLQTKRSFGDVQLHIEWLSPKDEGKSSQKYSNSGIFFMGIYELQILNSYENKTYANGQAESTYKQSPPLVNASKPPGEWQTYDIIFNAPKFDTQGHCIKKAHMTVFHNAVVIQNNFELKGPTLYIGESKYFHHEEKMPLLLQDHGDIIKFRNIWLREL